MPLSATGHRLLLRHIVVDIAKCLVFVRPDEQPLGYTYDNRIYSENSVVATAPVNG